MRPRPLSAPPELQGDGATRAAAFLRRELAPGERVLLFYESRDYLFRGLDYIPFFTAEASTMLQLVHRADDAADLRCRLQAPGVSHVLVHHEMPRPPGEFCGPLSGFPYRVGFTPGGRAAPACPASNRDRGWGSPPEARSYRGAGD